MIRPLMTVLASSNESSISRAKKPRQTATTAEEKLHAGTQNAARTFFILCAFIRRWTGAGLLSLAAEDIVAPPHAHNHESAEGGQPADRNTTTKDPSFGSSFLLSSPRGVAAAAASCSLFSLGCSQEWRRGQDSDGQARRARTSDAADNGTHRGGHENRKDIGTTTTTKGKARRVSPVQRHKVEQQRRSGRRSRQCRLAIMIHLRKSHINRSKRSQKAEDQLAKGQKQGSLHGVQDALSIPAFSQLSVLGALRVMRYQ